MFCHTLFQGNSVTTAKTKSVSTFPIFFLSLTCTAHNRTQPRRQSVTTYPIFGLLATYAIFYYQNVSTFPIFCQFLIPNTHYFDSYEQVMHNSDKTKKIIGHVLTQNRIGADILRYKIGHVLTQNRIGADTKPPQNRARIGFAVLFTKVVYTVLKYFISRHFFRFIKWRLKPHTISINLAVKTAPKKKTRGGAAYAPKKGKRNNL